MAGQAVGRIEGIKEGKTEAQIKIAIELHKKRFAIDEIAALTGLEEEQLKTLYQ